MFESVNGQTEDVRTDDGSNPRAFGTGALTKTGNFRQIYA